jgi:hypothetical protein
MRNIFYQPHLVDKGRKIKYDNLVGKFGSDIFVLFFVCTSHNVLLSLIYNEHFIIIVIIIISLFMSPLLVHSPTL